MICTPYLHPVDTGQALYSSRTVRVSYCMQYSRSTLLEFRSSGDDDARPKSLGEERRSQTLADDGLWRLARSCG